MTEVDDTRLWSSRMTRNPKCQLSATGGSHRGVVADVDGGPQSEELSRVLTLQETAEWLRVPPRQLGLLRVPCLDFGHKTKRYLARDVEAWLEQRRKVRSQAA